jgi:hypothetical protein
MNQVRVFWDTQVHSPAETRVPITTVFKFDKGLRVRGRVRRFTWFDERLRRCLRVVAFGDRRWQQQKQILPKWTQPMSHQE